MWRQRRGAEALAEEIGSARLEAFNRHLEGKYEEALATLTEVVRALDSAGLGVEDIALRRPTLDDVFLRLTGHLAGETGEEAA